MAIVPRVTCRRCGRQFSGMRSRCPYCGTRRIKQSERVPAPTPGENAYTPAGQRASLNTRWQMIFGGILVAAVILAVIVLVSVSLNGQSDVEESDTPVSALISSVPPTATPTPSPSPTATPTITSLNIYWGGSALADDTTWDLASTGTTLELTAQVWPSMDATALDGNLSWTVSDPSLASISTSGNSCTVVFSGEAGSLTLTVTCFGLTDSVILRAK